MSTDGHDNENPFRAWEDSLKPIGAPTDNPEREKRALHRLTTFLDKAVPQDQLQTVEQRVEFLKQLSADDFQKLLIRINGIVRDIPIRNRSMDGGGVEIGGLGLVDWVPPKEEDKPALFKEMWEKAQTLEDPQAIKSVVTESIIALHPFKDGNGRLARLISYLIDNGFDPNHADALEAYVADEKHRIYPKFKEVNQQLFLELQQQIPELAKFKYAPRVRSPLVYEEDRPAAELYLMANKGFSHEGIKTARTLFDQPQATALVMLKWLHDSGKYAKEYEEIITAEPLYPMIPLQTEDPLFQQMTEDDYKAVEEQYWQYKKKFVETLIEINATSNNTENK